MIFATILTLCTTVAVPCNEYVIDTASTASDAAVNKLVQSSDMHRAWMDDKQLQAHLAKFNIVEPLATLQSYQINNDIIPDNELP